MVFRRPNGEYLVAMIGDGTRPDALGILKDGALSLRNIIDGKWDVHYPRGFDRLRAAIGYRIRPSWVWQRKRYGGSELIVAVSNRGVAGIPGVLWLQIESPDGRLKLRGTLDPGHPMGGGIRMGAFLLPFGYTGALNLSAQLEIRAGVLKPVAWTCEQPLNADGSITLDVKRDDDPGWRKGV